MQGFKTLIEWETGARERQAALRREAADWRRAQALRRRPTLREALAARLIAVALWLAPPDSSSIGHRLSAAER